MNSKKPSRRKFLASGAAVAGAAAAAVRPASAQTAAPAAAPAPTSEAGKKAIKELIPRPSGVETCDATASRLSLAS